MAQPTARRLLLLTGGCACFLLCRVNTRVLTRVVPVGGLVVGDFRLCVFALHQPHVSLARHRHRAHAHLCPLHGHLHMHKKMTVTQLAEELLHQIIFGHLDSFSSYRWIKRLNRRPVFRKWPDVYILYCYYLFYL